MDRGDIALERTVGFYRNKATPGAEPLFLMFDDGRVLRIDFRDDHRHVGGAAMGRIVGDHRAFRLCIRFFQRPDFVLFHIHRAEHKIDVLCDRINVGRRVTDDHIRHFFRHRGFHGPAFARCFPVSLPGGTRGCRKHLYLKPRMVFQKGCKPLADHAGRANDTDLIFFHDSKYLPIFFVNARKSTRVFSFCIVSESVPQ